MTASGRRGNQERGGREGDGWKNRRREARKEGGKGNREEGNSRWRWKDRDKGRKNRLGEREK